MRLLSILIVLLPICAFALPQGKSALGKKDFQKHWRVESESPDYSLRFLGDTLEITAPKGLTLWRKEKIKGDAVIEFDACLMDETPDDRLSDLNCFWMASDPKFPNDIFKRADERSGVFVNCYALQLYYLGYGGNSNSTTRFRRYTGDERGVTDAAYRPGILKEYTDSAHLNKPNRWRHIMIEQVGDRTKYYIDGEKLVDYLDPEPLKEGWFGFRTTWSRSRIANFKYTELGDGDDCEVALHWVGEAPAGIDYPVSFGVPFNKGEFTSQKVYFPTEDIATLKYGTAKDASASPIACDQWPLAYWPDGSVKWLGVSAVIPGKSEADSNVDVRVSAPGGSSLIDSILIDGVCVAENVRLACRTQNALPSEADGTIAYKHFTSHVDKVVTERDGNIRKVVKITGTHRSADGSTLLPFIVRVYTYSGAKPVQLTHTIIYDGDCNKDFVNALGLLVDVPMREAHYNRHVAFATGDGGVWSEPIKPLVGRRMLHMSGSKGPSDLQQRQMQAQRIPEYCEFDSINRQLIDDWASWDGYRLSQLSADGFSVRKRANSHNPWIGTYSGHRTGGYSFAGDISGGLGVMVKDFWQAYPSSIEISGAKSDKATMAVWLWSPEAEPMDLRHYDDVAHGLNASYEDVQPGMSTPYGIARTSTIILVPSAGFKGKEAFAREVAVYESQPMLMPTPEYLHAKRAFGVWSLPETSTGVAAEAESRLASYIDFYQKAIEQERWYGFWNYGDVMHAYDPVRHTWRYDVGGYAWDNTELASNMWLWYNFLRTGRADIWQMATAMARHTGEVDVYHMGPMAGLGSRHNVSHWGCGAKEARISQAAFNRFYHYLAADERSADLMDEVADADQMLYEIDPMRLAQPRELYPCTAPARLRIGPDWMAYAGNWMSRHERTLEPKYADKIKAGMKSICALPSRIFTGPLALGYDPATGIITTECDSTLQSTNHLATIMGGFEVMNEIMASFPDAEWEDAWLEHAHDYKQKALEIRKSRFRVSRLQAYAAYKLRDPALAAEAWKDLMTRAEHTEAPKFEISIVEPPHVPSPIYELNGVSTNDAALWSLDAIYMLEVLR